jgi:ABC-type multidrug transport system fused ATPase/permease subunit
MRSLVRSIAELVALLRPPVRFFAVATALLAAVSLTRLAWPWIAGRTADALLTPASPGTVLAELLALWLAVIVAQAILSYTEGVYLGTTGVRLVAGLRQRLFEHLHRLPIHRHHDERRGQLVSLVSYDAEQLSSFVTGTLVRILPLVLVVTGAIAAMARIHPGLTLMALVVMPAGVLTIKIVGRRLRPLSREVVNRHGDQVAHLEESLELLPAIRAAAREEMEFERFRVRNGALLGAYERYLRLQGVLGPAVSLLGGIGLVAMVWLSRGLIVGGRLTAGDVVAIVLYGVAALGPISALASVYGQIQQAIGAAERILDVLRWPTGPGDDSAPDLAPVQGKIALRGVRFAYPGRPPLLQSVDLEVEAGETVAVVGDNGAGKSTLLYLLMRFFDPDDGVIEIDGADIRTVNPASLRRQVGFVSQTTLLLNGTIRDNVVFGAAGNTDEQLEAALDRAQALDFVRRLPEGIDTTIGDLGVKISGGQRQRLALARTLLSDCPILILDEATAMFDPDSEKRLVAGLRPVLEPRTVVMVTHRTAMLDLADRILRLDHGRLAPLCTTAV